MSSTINFTMPDDLINAARNRELILFIGAGLSKNISSDLPLGGQLIGQIAKVIGMDERILSIHTGGDYQILAEYLLHTDIYNIVIQELESAINNRMMSAASSRSHNLLVELETELIFTTNWDFWIEKAFSENNKHLNIIRKPSDLIDRVGSGINVYSNKNRQISHPTLIKYHGDFSDPSTLIFSIGSYLDRVIEESPYDIVLGNALLSKSVLFLGYSFSDLNLRLIWYKLLRHRRKIYETGGRREMPKSFIFATSQNPISEAWLKRIGIHTIHPDPDPRKTGVALEGLLDLLVEAQK
ncbi:hypothetical protein BTR14_06350 [Rhizobium rhizosphaerae]|uniref:SIR2-like domain-containing protein n=1 Tax=Xaviernesmea rhizosphaerae TaxID=1672749 RepID=A0ABX3PF76_9HYPH|nr:SIR2 family protein [Xaviernesmea rhizosphaerae]OQP87058.1 hypothetical protein BTR14_06350 [Xaviernesmea rhizosphaerae]